MGRRNCNSDQWWNNYKCQFECKKCHVYEKDFAWNPASCNCEKSKYLASIMDDSAIVCDEIIESYLKLSPKEDEKETKFDEKIATCKMQNLCILLAFLLINIALLIAGSIYCYLVKYREKQNHLLTFHFKSGKLKYFMY